MATEFTDRVVRVIKSIPKGKVMTYGLVAKAAGSPRGARQVVRILHTLSSKENLPWHRVINSKGEIALKQNEGFEIQQALLLKERIIFDINNKINLDKYLWIPN